jgi:peptidoglycan/xylan/chitin deacetylase (PgdA/CDA1 family)
MKNILSFALFFSGVLTLYQKRKLGDKLLVLMYHRVLTGTEMAQSHSNKGIIVNRDTFDAHITYLKKHFNIISVDQLVDHVKHQQPFKNPTCLITFDDGWIDNYTNALPILEKHKAPALIFLPINFIGTGNLFWQEKLSCYLHQIAANNADGNQILLEKQVIDSEGLSKAEIKSQISRYIVSLKKSGNAEIDEVIDQFKSYAAKYTSNLALNNIDTYLNWEQVKTMNKRGISFGSHAISHRLLSKFDDNEIEYEVAHSKKIIESQLQDNIDSIAYPNGDFNDNVIKKVKNNMYKVAFCTKQGYFTPGDDIYQIKRINIHQNAAGNIPLFLCHVLRIFK